MLEWIAVTGTAALAGAVTTLFVEDESPEDIGSTHKRVGRFVVALTRNALGGGLASYILWGTYTGSFNFNSTAYSPSESVAAILVGLGGTGALTQYLHIAREATGLKQATRQSADAAEELEAAGKQIAAKPPTSYTLSMTQKGIDAISTPVDNRHREVDHE